MPISTKSAVSSVQQSTSKEWEKLKYFAARFAWRRRNRMTPSYKHTWGDWFEQKYNQSLSAYADEIKKQKNVGSGA